MSLFNYDRAFFSLIKGIYDVVIFSSPDEAFKINALQNGGKVLVPFMSVWRLPDFMISQTVANHPMAKTGDRYRTTPSFQRANGDSGIMRRVHGLPVTLTYQVDIYASKRKDCDGLLAELALMITESPYLDVNFEDDRIGGKQFALVLQDSVSDNTSISEFEDMGRIYRMTLEVVIPEAMIYRVDGYDTKTVHKVMIDVGVLDREGAIEALKRYTLDGVDPNPEAIKFTISDSGEVKESSEESVYSYEDLYSSDYIGEGLELKEGITVEENITGEEVEE